MRAVLVGLLLHAAPALARPGREAPPSPEVVDGRVTVERVLELLAARGHQPEVQRADGRNTAMRLTLGGVEAFLVLGDQGTGVATDLYLIAVFQPGAPVSLERVNAWNQGARFSRAYLDPAGRPTLESDLPVVEGLTQAALSRFLDTFHLALAAFTRHLGWPSRGGDRGR